MSQSMQHKLSRLRPPRVQITYDVQTGSALKKKEIPFIVGIIAPLSGKSDKALPPLRQRKMVEIDTDNFNAVMESMEPKVSFSVPNTQPDMKGNISPAITFTHIDHFDPVQVMKKVPSLKKLYEERSRLRDFLAKLDGNDPLLMTIQNILVSDTRDDFKTMLSELLTSKDEAEEAQQKMIKASKNWASAESVLEEAELELETVDPQFAERKATAIKLHKDAVDVLAGIETALKEAKTALAAADKTDNTAIKAAKKLVNDADTKIEPAKTDAAEKLKAIRTVTAAAAAALAPEQTDIKATVTTAIKGSAEANSTLNTSETTAKENQETYKTKLDEAKKSKNIALMLGDGKLVLEPSQIPYAIDLVCEFSRQIISNPDLLPTHISSEKKTDIDVAAIITTRISQKDKIVSRQLNHILHHKDFQAMEASWRGLHYLVTKTETSTKLKLKVLNVSFDDLYKDLDKAVDFDQSALFKIVYEDEYGTYGGNPYSILVGDFQLGRSARDIEFLRKISGVAAAAHAPFIASAYAKLFDLEDFSSLFQPRDLSKIFESAELINWRAFRETEDSRYVTLTLPRVMLRLPYHHEDNPVEGIYFDEVVSVNLYQTDKNGKSRIKVDIDDDKIEYEKVAKKVDASKILWGNPAYILAQRITNAFSLYGWTAAIRGVEGGGLVEDLPAYTFETEEGDLALNCPTEVSITDRREKELNDLGFMAICHCKGSEKAAFFGGQTTNKPQLYLTDSASANARISGQLPYILAASRFAHYIKIIMREKIGSFMTRQNVENFLNTWIAQYVLLDDTPPQHIKAKYPLREASISVTDVPGKPGAYRATVFLKPHFQLEELTTSIRLVADLPS
ncbi:MAG: type VI secretion system protein ImpC [Paraglaciecola sp.]|jgi:type VI secretion system protein ImpC